MKQASCATCGSTTRALLCMGFINSRKPDGHAEHMPWGADCKCRVFRCQSCWRSIKRTRAIDAHSSRVEKEYGGTSDDYWRLYAAQGGKCAVYGCRARGKTRRLCIDHDHSCERSHPEEGIKLCCWRALVCVRHNDWFGQAGDDPLVFTSCAEILRNPPARALFSTHRR